jgi:hypothetical protein
MVERMLPMLRSAFSAVATRQVLFATDAIVAASRSLRALKRSARRHRRKYREKDIRTDVDHVRQDERPQGRERNYTGEQRSEATMAAVLDLVAVTHGAMMTSSACWMVAAPRAHVAAETHGAGVGALCD